MLDKGIKEGVEGTNESIESLHERGHSRGEVNSLGLWRRFGRGLGRWLVGGLRVELDSWRYLPPGERCGRSRLGS